MKVAVYIKSLAHVSAGALSAKPTGKVTKTKTALKQETHKLSDLKHDPHCGFVELGGSVSVSS